MYGCDDFYEPSEFEQQIEEFKASLYKSVKQEFLDKMAQLEKENADLQVFKERKEDIEKEHRNALSEMKRNAVETERKIRYEKLRGLLGECLTVGWGVKTISTKPPKCDKCDKDRRIQFTSPSGKKLSEPCSCDDGTHAYEPQELTLIKFYMDNEKRGRNEEYVERHYKKTDGQFNSDYYEYIDSSNIYKGESFDTTHQYGIVFLDKETCQKYCDWLNEQKSK
jgi:hypothetical protein